MNYLKKVLTSFIYFSIVFFIFLFIITTLYYFGLISYNTSNILKLIILIVSLFISGFINGKKSNKNGWFEGIKLSIIYLIIIILINLFIGDFSFKNIIFYLIIMITCILSSMIGINVKTK